jgi:hypothetical protein
MIGTRFIKKATDPIAAAPHTSPHGGATVTLWWNAWLQEQAPEGEGEDAEQYTLRIAWQYRRYLKPAGSSARTAARHASASLATSPPQGQGMGSRVAGAGGGEEGGGRKVRIAAPATGAYSGRLKDWCHEFDLARGLGEEALTKCRAVSWVPDGMHVWGGKGGCKLETASPEGWHGAAPGPSGILQPSRRQLHACNSALHIKKRTSALQQHLVQPKHVCKGCLMAGLLPPCLTRHVGNIT